MSIRRTVALLVERVDVDYFGELIEGAKAAAEEKNLNLLVVAGGKYERDRQSSVLYQLAKQESVDAIVCASGALVLGDEGYRCIERDCGDKPVLLLSDRHKDLPSIYYDSSEAINDIMEFLVREKECERIVMFAGPEHSSDASDRLEGYMKAMAKYHLPVEDRMIVRGNHTSNCVEEARRLIEQNPAAEAVICGNDFQAKAMYHVLHEMDKEIGKDILVVGFDDWEECRFMDPPLASVQASRVKLGYEATVLAGRIADGEEPKSRQLKCTFVKRESVGYDPHRSLTNFEQRKSVSAITVFDIPKITRSMTDFVFVGDSLDYQSECQRKLLEDFLSRFLTRYLGNIVRRSTFDSMNYVINNIFDKESIKHVDTRRLFRVLDSVYKVYRAREKSEYAGMELTMLIDSIKMKVVDSLERNIGDKRKVESSAQKSVLRLSDDLISTDPEGGSRYVDVMKALTNMGVLNASLFMFEKPVHYDGDGEFVYPDKLYLKVYMDRSGIHEIDRKHQETRTADIMDYRYLEGGRSHMFFAMGIRYVTMHYGLLLLDLDQEYFQHYELLNNQINMAVSHFTEDREEGNGE